MRKTNEKQNGNGHGKYKPEKVWNMVDDNSDFWWGEQPEIPGQDEIINMEALKDELFEDEDIENQGDN